MQVPLQLGKYTTNLWSSRLWLAHANISPLRTFLLEMTKDKSLWEHDSDQVLSDLGQKIQHQLLDSKVLQVLPCILHDLTQHLSTLEVHKRHVKRMADPEPFNESEENLKNKACKLHLLLHYAADLVELLELLLRLLGNNQPLRSDLVAILQPAINFLDIAQKVAFRCVEKLPVDSTTYPQMVTAVLTNTTGLLDVIAVYMSRHMQPLQAAMSSPSKRKEMAVLSETLQQVSESVAWVSNTSLHTALSALCLMLLHDEDVQASDFIGSGPEGPVNANEFLALSGLTPSGVVIMPSGMVFSAARMAADACAGSTTSQPHNSSGNAEASPGTGTTNTAGAEQYAS